MSVSISPKNRSLIFGIIIAVCGLAVLLSTVLPWFAQVYSSDRGSSDTSENMTVRTSSSEEKPKEEFIYWSGWRLVVPPQALSLGKYLDLQVVEAPRGNVAFRWSGHVLLFTGLWTLLLGFGLIVCAVLLLLKSRFAGLAAARFAGLAAAAMGALGCIIAVTNILMVFWPLKAKVATENGIFTTSSSSMKAVVGSGLWVLLIFAAISVVVGIIGYRFGAET